jgi:hypothetical protein
MLDLSKAENKACQIFLIDWYSIREASFEYDEYYMKQGYKNHPSVVRFVKKFRNKIFEEKIITKEKWKKEGKYTCLRLRINLAKLILLYLKSEELELDAIQERFVSECFGDTDVVEYIVPEVWFFLKDFNVNYFIQRIFYFFELFPKIYGHLIPDEVKEEVEKRRVPLKRKKEVLFKHHFLRVKNFKKFASELLKKFEETRYGTSLHEGERKIIIYSLISPIHFVYYLDFAGRELGHIDTALYSLKHKFWIESGGPEKELSNFVRNYPKQQKK